MIMVYWKNFRYLGGFLFSIDGTGQFAFIIDQLPTMLSARIIGMVKLVIIINY